MSGFGYSLASVGPPPGVEEYTIYCLKRRGFRICY